MPAVTAVAPVAAVHPALVRVTSTEYRGEEIVARRVSVRAGHARLALYAALADRLRPWALGPVLDGVGADPPLPGEAVIYAWWLEDRFELEVEVLACDRPGAGEGEELAALADELAAAQRPTARCVWLS